MRAMKTCFHNTLRHRKLKRSCFWVVCSVLICTVLFVNHFTILTVLKYISNYGAQKEMEDNTNIAEDIVQQYRSVQMKSELPTSKLKMASQNPYQDLRSDLSPSIVHYIWSRRGYFEFRHYLALKRVIDIVKPDAVFFHFTHLPETDTENYYTWFNRIQKKVSHFVLNKINSTTETSSLGLILHAVRLVHQYGGIYVPESSMVTRIPVSLRSFSFVSGLSSTNIALGLFDGLLVGKKQGFKRPETTSQLLFLLDTQDENHAKVAPCVPEHQIVDEFNVLCIKMDKPLNPKDIWYNDTQISLLSRLTMYGVPIVTPFNDKKRPIPRIAHYVCAFDCEITFLGYLSMLSAIYVARFNYVYIHGPAAPVGAWWERLARRSQFVYVQREVAEWTLDGQSVPPTHVKHLMRLHILLKYGGVCQDMNTLWTQAISEELLQYEAVVSPDWHTHGAWPESINHGVMMAKPNSEYVRELHAMFVKNRQVPAWFIDHYMSYRMIELNPEVVLVDPHLQVKCVNHNCHPTWQPGYRSTVLQNRPGQIFSWQNETLSVHWVDSFPDLNADMVRYTSGMVVEISRFILAAADVQLNSL